MGERDKEEVEMNEYTKQNSAGWPELGKNDNSASPLKGVDGGD